MTTPASNQDEPSKMRKLTSGDANEAIHSRLPRGTGPGLRPAPVADKKAPAAPAPKSTSRLARFKFLPAFWTIASVMSMVVNIVLIIVLLAMLRVYREVQALEPVQRLQSAQVFQETTDPRAMLSSVLGGLYTNFVKMDAANIRTNIHVEKEIPVQFSLNVSGPTNVTLSQDVTINGALVTVETGGLNIVNARATIVLPQDTVLPINIQNLVVPVDQKVLAVLDVPVDIPLDQTELHEPFVGLQKVVEPWYCLVEPEAAFNGLQVCSPGANPAQAEPVVP
jgi:hypothetical protein